MSEELKPVAWQWRLMRDREGVWLACSEEAAAALDTTGAETRALYDEATISALQSRIAELEAKAKLPEALHTFLNAAGGEGLVLDGVDAGDLYEQLFPERYQEQIDKAFGAWEPAIDAAIAAKEPRNG